MSTDGRFVRNGRILSVSERRGMEKEKEREKAYLGNKLEVGGGDTLGSLPERRRLYVESQFSWDPGLDDKMAVHSRIRKIDRALANGASDSISEAEKVAIERRSREHEEFFKKNMNTRKATGLPYNHPDFSKAVQAGLREHSPEFQKRATDWKNIQRQLNPDDASASNLERIRPD